MSVRSEIHEAFDELAPRTVGLEERVLATVAVDRGAKLRWAPRLRAPLSLVAVVLVIAVVAGALMGGRLLADWKKFTAPPVPAVPQTPLQKLEARPLHFKAVHSVADCPDSSNADGSIGPGPLYLAGSAVNPQSSWGSYSENLLYANGPFQGPLLMRAEDILKNQPIIFIGEYAGGPLYGADVLNGQVVQQRLEMIVDPIQEPFSWRANAG
ncbi:MAG TPA: hypothetical protein VI384_08285, partial [Candidatus Dormibacteraeota bacterium]